MCIHKNSFQYLVVIIQTILIDTKISLENHPDFDYQLFHRSWEIVFQLEHYDIGFKFRVFLFKDYLAAKIHKYLIKDKNILNYIASFFTNFLILFYAFKNAILARYLSCSSLTFFCLHKLLNASRIFL